MDHSSDAIDIYGECYICFEPYDKNIVAFKCNHFVCKNCYTKMQSFQKRHGLDFVCPQCRHLEEHNEPLQDGSHDGEYIITIAPYGGESLPDIVLFVWCFVCFGILYSLYIT